MIQINLLILLVLFFVKWGKSGKLNFNASFVYGLSNTTIFLSDELSNDLNQIIIGTDIGVSIFRFSLNNIDGVKLNPLSTRTIANQNSHQLMISRNSISYPLNISTTTTKYGHIYVEYLCQYEGSYRLKSTVAFIRSDGSTSSYSFQYTKLCPKGNVGFILMKDIGSTGVSIIENGYVNYQFHQKQYYLTHQYHENTLLFSVIRNTSILTSTIVYEIFSSNNLINVTYQETFSLHKKTNSRLLIKFNTESDMAISLITMTVSIPNLFNFTILFQLHYVKGNVPGFYVFTDEKKIRKHNIIISNGHVNQAYFGENPQIEINRGDSCFDIDFISHIDQMKVVSLEWEALLNNQMIKPRNLQESDEDNIVYNDLFVSFFPQTFTLSSNSTELSLCHTCYKTNKYIVTIYLNYLDKNGKSMTIQFSYIKSCYIGRYPVDITAGIYNLFQRETYVINRGQLTPYFTPNNLKMTVRKEEIYSNFYITSYLPTSISNLELLYDGNALLCNVQFIGYDRELPDKDHNDNSDDLGDFDDDYDYDDDDGKLIDKKPDDFRLRDWYEDYEKIEIKDRQTIVLEVTYTCLLPGSYVMFLSFVLQDDRPISFSWIKECPYIYKNYFVSTDYNILLDFITSHTDISGDINDGTEYYPDIIFNGIVQPDFVPNHPSSTIEEFDTFIFYIAAKNDSNNLYFVEKPSVSSKNKDIQVYLEGDMLTTRYINDTPLSLTIKFNCKAQTTSQIDVILYLANKVKSQDPVHFSFLKSCENPSNYNTKSILDYTLIICSIIICLLVIPVIMSFFIPRRRDDQIV